VIGLQCGASIGMTGIAFSRFEVDVTRCDCGGSCSAILKMDSKDMKVCGRSVMQTRRKLERSSSVMPRLKHSEVASQ